MVAMEGKWRSVGKDYREHLRTAVGSSAAPYGYTLATWTTGAVLTHAYGVPTALVALLFMAGAVLAFAAVGVVAFGGVSTRFAHAPRQAALWGSFHFLSVGGAIGAAALVTYLLTRGVGWLAAPFAATVTYLLVLGAQFAVADERDFDRRERTASTPTFVLGAAGQRERHAPRPAHLLLLLLFLFDPSILLARSELSADGLPVASLAGARSLASRWYQSAHIYVLRSRLNTEYLA